MNVPEILSGLPRVSAVVIGDICLDRWCSYDPSAAEDSRETGIPRIGIVSNEVTPGAGGTVASNLKALGAGRVAVLGVTGDDGAAVELGRALEERGIETQFLVKAPEFQTFTYTKLINSANGIEDQPRTDFINVRPLPEEIEAKLIGMIRSAVEDFEVILISDQAETSQGGVITPKIRSALAGLAERNRHKVFWVDSRSHTEGFRKMIIKPNQYEADTTCMRLFGRKDYKRLRELLEADLLFVTQGPEGVLIVGAEGETWVRTREVSNPVDICGAGDSFSAGAAMALAVTGSTMDAAAFGNLVASVTIMKKMTGTASPVEVLEAALASDGR